MRVRPFLIAFAFLVIGVGVFVYGHAKYTSDTVSCAGQTMFPGDTCVSFGRGGNGTYESMMAGQRRVGMIEMIGGPVVALFSLYAMVRAVRPRRAGPTRRRLKGAAADTATLADTAARTGWSFPAALPDWVRALNLRLPGERSMTDGDILVGEHRGRPIAVCRWESTVGGPNVLYATVLAQPVVQVRLKPGRGMAPSIKRRLVRMSPKADIWIDSPQPDAARQLLTDTVAGYIVAHPVLGEIRTLDRTLYVVTRTVRAVESTIEDLVGLADAMAGAPASR
jgi:hypothetical protein